MVMSEESITTVLRTIVHHLEANKFESAENASGALLADQLEPLLVPSQGDLKTNRYHISATCAADAFGYLRVYRLRSMIRNVKRNLHDQNTTLVLSNAKTALARWERY